MAARPPSALREKSVAHEATARRRSSDVGPERVGKKQLAIWVDDDVWREVHYLAFDNHQTCRHVLLCAIGRLLDDTGREVPPLAREAMQSLEHLPPTRPAGRSRRPAAQRTVAAE